MATTMTPFTSDQSDGTLPNAEPSTRFQYSHYVNWQTTASASPGLGREGKGTWHIQLIDPSNNVIFEQIVSTIITVIFFGFELVWYYYGTQDVFVTTIIGGQSVTEPLSSQYVIGTEEGYMIPGGDDVPAYGSDGGIVSAAYYSPIYIMDVPVGTKLHVVSDTWGLGVQTRPEWQWSFLLGGSAVSSFFDQSTGMTWQAFTQSTGTVVQNTRQLRFGTDVQNVVTIYPAAAHYAKLFRIGTSVFCVADIGGLRLFETRDDGVTWGQPMAYFQDVSVLAACPSLDGGQIFIYGTANTTTSAWNHGDVVFLIVQRDGAAWTVRNSGKVTTPNMPTQKIAGMDFAGGTLVLSVNLTSTMSIYQSTDEMQNWTEVTIS